MSEVLGYQEFMEAMDAVNPKAVKKKFKDRKDTDIDNDGDVDASDKYLHKRRKAVSKAVKSDESYGSTGNFSRPMSSAERAKEMQKKADQIKKKAQSAVKKAKGLTMGEDMEEGAFYGRDDLVKKFKTKNPKDFIRLSKTVMTKDGKPGGTETVSMKRKGNEDKIAKYKKDGYKEVPMESYEVEFHSMLDENTGVANKAKKSGIPKGILMQVYRRGMAAYGTGHRPGASQAQWAMARVNSFIGKGKGTWGGADKDLAAKARESMKKESLDEEMPASFKAMLIQRDKMKKLGQNIDAINAKIKKARADAMRMTFNKEEVVIFEDAKDVLKRMRQTRDNLKRQGNSAGLAAIELRIKKFKDSMSKESIDEKGPGLYANINAKRKRGEKMRKKGEKGAPSAQDFENAKKTAREERELCHSKDHDCATVVEHIVWGFGKPVYESHAIPTDDGYVSWYDVEFEHGIEREVPTEDLKIYTTEAHDMKTLNKGKKKPKSKDKAEPVKEEDKEPAYVRNKNHYKDSARVKSNLAKAKDKMAQFGRGSKYSDSEISRAVDIAKKMAGGNYTGAYKKIEGIKKGLAQQGKVKYALKKAAESFETWKGLSISEVNDVLVDMVASAQDYIKLVEDGDLKSVDEPEVEIAKGMPLSFKQFQSKIGD